MTGEVTAGNTLTAHYWWQNVRQPVRFEAAVDTLVAEGFTHFIEVGPHAILGGYMRAIAKKHQIDVKIGYLMHRAGLGRRATSVCSSHGFGAYVRCMARNGA